MHELCGLAPDLEVGKSCRKENLEKKWNYWPILALNVIHFNKPKISILTFFRQNVKTLNSQCLKIAIDDQSMKFQFSLEKIYAFVYFM